MPTRVIALSAKEARRVALAAQGLIGARPTAKPGSATSLMLRTVRAVQIDTISVLARSHELVAYARLGPVPRTAIEAAYWGPGSATFEYWSHAACILPIEEWPTFAFKRRSFEARGRRWHWLEDAEKSCRHVTDRLRAEGPLTARELGGAKRGGPWWDWSEIKIAAEWLLDIGVLACRERRGFQRVYELAERAIPPELRAIELDDESCYLRLTRGAGEAMGVATASDLAAYHGMHRRHVERAIPDSGLLPATVEGWDQPAFVAEPALEALGRRMRGRTALISPFDSLAWDRARVERLFDFQLRLEAYVPRPKRVHGYFAMPVLAGERLVGRVDPGRDGTTLVAKKVSLETPEASRHVAAALVEAASWVGCDRVVVNDVSPAERTGELRSLVEAATA
jgi:uncharacterized protein YcaQ